MSDIEVKTPSQELLASHTNMTIPINDLVSSMEEMKKTLNTLGALQKDIDALYKQLEQKRKLHNEENAKLTELMKKCTESEDKLIEHIFNSRRVPNQRSLGLIIGPYIEDRLDREVV